MKRLLAVLLVSILLITVMAGCGSSKSGTQNESSPSTPQESASRPAETKEITVWMKKQLVPEANDIVIERGKEFAEKNNVKVNVEVIAYEDFMPKWTAAIESGKTPDVSFFGYQEVGQFYEKGVLADVSALYEKINKEQSAFYPSLKNAVTFQEKQYGIPFWAEATVMYYRKDILAAAGFNEPPQTWDDFRKVAKATTDAAKGIYGAGIGYGKGNSDAEFFTRALIWSFGGAEVDTAGKKVIVNSPETVAAAKYITDIFTVDKTTPPSSVSWDDAGNNKAYLSGQSVMILNSGSVANAAKKDNPDLYKNTGLAPFPAGPKGRFVPGIENTLGIFKNSKNQELAQQLIEFYLEKAWYTSWIEKSAPLLVPVYSALESEAVWQDPMNKPFIQSVKDFTFLGNRGNFNSKAGEVYNLRLINDAFQRMLVDKVTPDKAIAELQAKLEEVYKK